MKKEYDLNELAQAIFTVNRHAKTALEPKHLYKIKKDAIEKLLKQNKAKKIGLHYVNNPKYSMQYSTLLIQVADYYFHIPPSKEDFETLDHLGELDETYRNPKTQMSLSKAKKIIYDFIDFREERNKVQTKKSAYYIPSSLGKHQWPPPKRKSQN